MTIIFNKAAWWVSQPWSQKEMPLRGEIVAANIIVTNAEIHMKEKMF